MNANGGDDEYVEEYRHYLTTAEERYTILGNVTLPDDAVGLLFRLCKALRLDVESVFLCVELFVRCDTPRDVGTLVVCLLVATKHRDDRDIDTRDVLAYMARQEETHPTPTHTDLVAAEWRIVAAPQFTTLLPTTYQWARIYGLHVKKVDYVCALVLQHASGERPSLIAAAAFYMVHRHIHPEARWTARFQRLTGYARNALHDFSRKYVYQVLDQHLHAEKHCCSVCTYYAAQRKTLYYVTHVSLL